MGPHSAAEGAAGAKARAQANGRSASIRGKALLTGGGERCRRSFARAVAVRSPPQGAGVWERLFSARAWQHRLCTTSSRHAVTHAHDPSALVMRVLACTLPRPVVTAAAAIARQQRPDIVGVPRVRPQMKQTGSANASAKPPTRGSAPSQRPVTTPRA